MVKRSKILNFIKLYHIYLQIPRAVQKYPLDITVPQGRSRVRQQFQLYSNYFKSLPSPSPSSPTKLSAMNAALLKGTQELIEVHNRWSQKTHVMRWFEGAGEMDSPLLLAKQSEKEIKAINENISKVNVSPFLEEFLTNGQTMKK